MSDGSSNSDPPAKAAGWDALVAEQEKREARADEGGGRARQDRHRRLGRWTARERIAALCDAGSFVELGRHALHCYSGESDSLAANLHPGDGLICGLGSIEGKNAAVYAHDPTVLRGALGHAAAQKLCRLLDLAGERRLPVIALVDCDGVRIEEGTFAIEAYGEVIRRTVRLKGKIPQLTLASGLCVGAAAYTATLTDLVGMVRGQSYMFITGPKVTKVVTGEEVTLDDLGGPELHAKKTGACHAVLPDEAAGIDWLKRCLRYLASQSSDDVYASSSRVDAAGETAQDAPDRRTPELEQIVPTSDRRAYDARKLLAAIVDRGSLLEISPSFAPNLLTAFARMGNRSVAFLASNPNHLAGCLDVDASRKGAAFVSLASSAGLPVVTLVDVPGYLPGKKQEEGGIIPHGATLLTAYGNAKTPLICLVVRKSFGGASVLSFAADVRLALPTARIAPMGVDAAVEVALGPENPDASEAEKIARQARREGWLAKHDHAWAAAESGYIDQVIAPAEVRRELCRALDRLCWRGAGKP